MNRENEGVRTLLSTAISAIFFLIMVFGFKWNFFVVAVLSVLVYFASSFLLTPVKKIGNVAVEHIDQGERISQIYDRADKDIKDMISYQRAIRDPDLSEKARLLAQKGVDIENYLTNNLRAISASEHFLEYYLGTANKIISNYVEIEDSRISPEKASLIKSETSDSLDYLLDIFTRQLDSYYDDRILSLEIESDLLEKTVKLGGGRN